jgi:hypothetical protein
MKNGIVLAVLMGAIIGLIDRPGQVQAQQSAQPEFVRAPDALERVTWRTRTLVGNERLTNWKLAIPGGGLTFLESVVRADAAIVNFVEGSSSQKVGPRVQKNLDHNLSAEEIATIRSQMGPNVRISSYRVDILPDEVASRRKLFEFAKALGINAIIVPFNSQLGGLDALADESGVNVAVLGNGSLLMKALEGRSKRLGIGIDTGTWAQEGISPRDGLAMVKDRLLYVNLRDRSGRASNARNVLLGKGVANLTEFFNELNRLNVRPLVMTLDTSGVVKSPADLFTAVAAFEDAVQPAYAANFTEFSRTRPIRRDLVTPARGETLSPVDIQRRSAEIQASILDAIPPKPYAAPKKARKLLVIESLEGMSHNTIPHANVMIEEMGKKTGAWTTEFSNDLNNLRYPKIKDYDAVFLNSIVGEFLPDLKMREDLVRYVREGGGLGGIHGTPWASRNWDEFAEMIGAQSAPHRIENGVMKVYDKASPIVAPFNYEDLPFREEYYRFEHEGQGRLRWDKVRVLLTVELDNPKIEPRPWTGYKRPNNVYPVAWIRSYGKGRIFYNSLGHMEETFTQPEIVGHFLAGIQFMLGDLQADTAPNPHK